MKPILAKGQQLQFLDLGASAKAGIRSELTLLDSSATLLGTRNGNNEKILIPLSISVINLITC